MSWGEGQLDPGGPPALARTPLTLMYLIFHISEAQGHVTQQKARWEAYQRSHQSTAEPVRSQDA